MSQPKKMTCRGCGAQQEPGPEACHNCGGRELVPLAALDGETLVKAALGDSIREEDLQSDSRLAIWIVAGLIGLGVLFGVLNYLVFPTERVLIYSGDTPKKAWTATFAAYGRSLEASAVSLSPCMQPVPDEVLPVAFHAQWVVGPDGTLSQLTLLESSLSPQEEACVRPILQALQLEAPPDKKPVAFDVPYTGYRSGGSVEVPRRLRQRPRSEFSGF